jgi:hypothetical protein
MLCVADLLFYTLISNFEADDYDGHTKPLRPLYSPSDRLSHPDRFIKSDLGSDFCLTTYRPLQILTRDYTHYKRHAILPKPNIKTRI